MQLIGRELRDERATSGLVSLTTSESYGELTKMITKNDSKIKALMARETGLEPATSGVTGLF
jgi:hypothetical protein